MKNQNEEKKKRAYEQFAGQIGGAVSMATETGLPFEEIAFTLLMGAVTFLESHMDRDERVFLLESIAEHLEGGAFDDWVWGNFEDPSNNPQGYCAVIPMP